MNYSHLNQAQIDANYANAQNVANIHLANGNSQAAHQQHLFMQQMVAASQALNKPAPSGGAVHHHPSAPAPAPYVPPPPPRGQDQVNYIPVKIPEANIVTWNSNPVDADTLERLYFENVGGTEILAVARHDTVGGEPVATTPIANLESIQLQFNPLNILTSTKAQQLFNQFSIDIDTHMYDSSNAVSLSDDKQWIVIQLDYLNADEYVQIQVSGDDDEYWIYDETWYNTGGGTE